MDLHIMKTTRRLVPLVAKGGIGKTVKYRTNLK